MQQHEWDRDDAKLLLSYYLKCNRGELSEEDAILIVSNELSKKRAEEFVAADEFGSPNDVLTHFLEIADCYQNDNNGGKRDVFSDVVAQYKVGKPDNNFDLGASGNRVEHIVDFSISNSYKYTKPISCEYKGHSVQCNGWNELYINLVKLIYTECAETFPISCKLSSSSRIDIGNSDGMVNPKEISDNLYLECNVSATTIINKLRSLFKLCGIDHHNVVIKYTKPNDIEAIRRKRSIPAEGVEYVPRFSSIIKQIISEHYVYGFPINSEMHIMRLRNFAEMNNVILPESNEDLQKEILASGVKIEGKIFALDESLLDGVALILDNIFDTGINVVFFDCLMEINKQFLEQHHVISPEMLKSVSRIVRPDLFYGLNFISKGKINEQEAVVQEVNRVCGDEYFVDCDSLEHKLPYIPANKIVRCLSSSLEFVWNGDGSYFVLRHFTLSDSDKEFLYDYVKHECDLHGYVSIAKLPYQKISDEYFELTERAMQESIYNALFKDEYYLKDDKILTKCNEIDLTSLLTRNCKNKAQCTVSELLSIDGELAGVSNKQRVLAVLYDSMIRISENDFISDVQIDFDCKKIDEILLEIVGNRFTPIKSIATFALFPSCGVSWNYYLLESYCYRFSKQFKLLVNHFNDKNVGIIVPKGLDLSYFEILCDAAAFSNVELTEEMIGQYFFENGYTAKRKYSNISTIIEHAKKKREGV